LIISTKLGKKVGKAVELLPRNSYHMERSTRSEESGVIVQNIPNILSACRIVMLAPLVLLILLNQPVTYAVATFLFLLVALTDTIDGRLARHYNLVSTLGVFLDLTADKMLVAGLLIALVEVHLVPSWIVIIIVAREFLVMGMRSLAASAGKVIPAGRWGKQKTFLTLLAMGGILLGSAFGPSQLTLFPIHFIPWSQLNFDAVLLFAADLLMILALIWTILSAVEYMRDATFLFRPKEKTAQEA
jgi:CDP-diacylglycerol---glycerol-3-phosphate 3-phosphatidyltransferase